MTARYAPKLAESLVKEKAQELARRPEERLVLLRAEPRWLGPELYEFNGQVVRIVPCVSGLAVLAALEELAAGERLIALTDREPQELGSAVLLHAVGQRIETLDESALTPGLFGVTHVDARIHPLGAWFSVALLQHRPPAGWPVARAGTLTADFAVRSLLEQVLGLPVRGSLDLVMLLDSLDDNTVRARWRELDEETRAGLVKASRQILGDVASLALTAVAGNRAVSVLAVGLAVDVLWPGGGNADGNIDRIAARTRAESILGSGVTESSARAFAETAVSILLRRDAAGADSVDTTLTQAEALLTDLRWPTGAETSAVLPAGMGKRLRNFAETVVTAQHDITPAKASAVERAYSSLREHLLAHRAEHELSTAAMALRLVRWITNGDTTTSAAGLAQAAGQYLRDGGWVDRALAAVWNGAADPIVAAAYAGLAEHVRTIRNAQDGTAATHLTGDAKESDDLILVESLLTSVVLPLRNSAPVLLLVLDGMSVAVATEIAQDVAAAGWIEIVSEAQRRRVPVLAALPTLTTYSRTSLFAGRLLAGQQSVEKSQFAAAVDGIVFHKDDLRAGGGASLPDTVTAAITDRSRKVVGIVINTIDDALAKADPSGMRWGLAEVQHLRAILAQAAQAGRTVILTSDHGHVIERGGEHRPVAGASARWRSPESGPVSADEILVQGPRVLAPGNAAILARTEGLRYTAKAAGYHGGASLAELTIPLVVFRRPEVTEIDGWVDATPQVPAWWNEPLHVTVAPVERITPRRGKPAPVDESQAAFDFDIPEVETPIAARLSDGVLASDVYASQERRAGRGRLDRTVVARVIDLLAEHNGRAHKDTVAAGIGIAATAVEPTLAMLRRQLNFDGFEVVSIDADGVTVVLDESLLREQFGVRGD